MDAKLITVTLRSPCRACGHYRFRLEAERREDCPVVCARCGRCAGSWGRIRANGVAGISEGLDATVTRIIGRTLARRRR